MSFIYGRVMQRKKLFKTFGGEFTGFKLYCPKAELSHLSELYKFISFGFLRRLFKYQCNIAQQCAVGLLSDYHTEEEEDIKLQAKVRAHRECSGETFGDMKEERNHLSHATTF